MFAPANQPHFTLTLEDPDLDFQVLSFKGREAISEPFAFEVVLVSEQRDLDPERLLHRPAFLRLGPDGHGIHGQVYRAARGEAGRRQARYILSLRPRLAYLAHRFDQRIFQHLSVPAIIGQVLEAHGILGNAYAFTLGTPCPERDYCVQYDESDLHFIQRLCEEEGLHYHFQHSPDGHRLVFGDDPTVFGKLPAMAYQPGSGQAAEAPVVTRFGVRVQARTSRTTRRDYDFEYPRLDLQSQARAKVLPDLEDYRYPGRFTHRDRGTQLAQRALERQRGDACQAKGHSDQPRLASGHGLPLQAHPTPEWNRLWLLTEVVHEGRQPQVLEEVAGERAPAAAKGFEQGYRNRFRAIPANVLFRPALRHPKPRLLGSQTAIVTGPPGEEIHCDRYGRVKVKFHWDRATSGDDKTSCWLRVSSAWAGARYGGIAIPRVGMEVVVSFLEGDPDQPLITGCLYHGEHLPPYELPQHKTRSGFKTLSSPGGGHNELRIEDRKGQEQIFVHAQRDWHQNVGHDQVVCVGHERHDSVAHHSYSEFKAEEHRTVHADRKVQVRASDHLTVADQQHVRVGTAQLVDVGQEIHLRSGLTMVLEAGGEISLKSGGSFLRIDAGGITLSGPLINLNSGGSPGNGTGAAPLLPGPSQPAEASKPGQVLQQRLVENAPLVELCQKPKGGTPLQCPLADCPCRKALMARAET